MTDPLISVFDARSVRMEAARLAAVNARAAMTAGQYNSFVGGSTVRVVDDSTGLVTMILTGVSEGVTPWAGVTFNTTSTSAVGEAP